MPAEPDEIPSGPQGTTVSTADVASTPTPDVQVPAATATQTPATQTAPATTPAQTAAASTQTAPDQAAADPAVQAAAAQQNLTVRDYLKSLGYQGAGDYQDDRSALQAMYSGFSSAQQQLAEAKRMATYGQLWLDQQSKAQTAPATPAADPLAAFKAPEFDPRWASQILKDPTTGELRVAPGADPTILPKMLAYQQHREKISDQFLQDPVSFINKIVESAIPQRANEIVEKRLAALQEQQFADNFISQNEKFLFQHDAVGRKVTNPITGQPIPTADGAYFYHAMKYGHDRFGITDSAKQAEFAQMAMKARNAEPALATQTAVRTGQQAQQAVLDANRHNPNQSGSMVGAGNTGHLAPDTQNTGLSLTEQLRIALNGVPIRDEN